MSERINGALWGLMLSREERYLALALGDHADHEGANIFPSIGLLAWKTDYTPRRVQQLMRKLQARGILVKVESCSGRRNVASYRIDLAAAKPKDALRKGRNPVHPFDQKGETQFAERVKPSSQKGEIQSTKGRNPVLRSELYESPLIKNRNLYAHALPAVDEDHEQGNRKPPARASIPPTFEQVTAYVNERGRQIDAQAFFDYYNANGWKVGRNPMRDWQASVRYWERNGVNRNHANGNRAQQRQNDNLRALNEAFPLDR
jgi:hypothetical protein